MFLLGLCHAGLYEDNRQLMGDGQVNPAAMYSSAPFSCECKEVCCVSGSDGSRGGLAHHCFLGPDLIPVCPVCVGRTWRRIPSWVHLLLCRNLGSSRGTENVLLSPQNLLEIQAYVSILHQIMQTAPQVPTGEGGIKEVRTEPRPLREAAEAHSPGLGALDRPGV